MVGKIKIGNGQAKRLTGEKDEDQRDKEGVTREAQRGTLLRVNNLS